MSRLRQQLLESLRLALEASLGDRHATDLSSERTRAGICVECGAPVEAHFDRRNQWAGHTGGRGRRAHV